MIIKNLPAAKAEIVKVCHDCFPEELSTKGRTALAKAYTEKHNAEEIYVN